MIIAKELGKRFAYRPGVRMLGGGHEVDPREGDGWFDAVKEVSFECGPGEVLGLLGANGAGKTTVMRMLAAVIKPSSGKLFIDGVDVVCDPMEVRRRIGFLSGSTASYGRLTVRENIEYFGRLQGLSNGALRNKFDELLEILQFADFADKQVDQLSTGMRQKCAIARTLIHSPQIVILDEPTTGLDVIAVRELLNLFQGYKKLGVRLIFSTHHLHEVEKLCDKVCVIHKGRSIFNGSVGEMRGLTQSGLLFDAFAHVVAGGKEC